MRWAGACEAGIGACQVGIGTGKDLSEHKIYQQCGWETCSRLSKILSTVSHQNCHGQHFKQ